MGDRVSIQFVNGKEKSVVLFSHWGGVGFVKEARTYAKELKAWAKKEEESCGMPLNRFEPRTVMVDFIRHITKGMPRVESDLYLGINANDGDNSDNGHFVIDLGK